MKNITLSFVLVSFFTAQHSYAQMPKDKLIALKEYCGKKSSIKFAFEYMKWDCTNNKHKSILEIENLVSSTHSALGRYTSESKLRAYVLASSERSGRTFWIFHSKTKAVRYRAIYENDEYKHTGITTFCIDTISECVRFESEVTTGLSGFVDASVGPPAAVIPGIPGFTPVK